MACSDERFARTLHLGRHPSEREWTKYGGNTGPRTRRPQYEPSASLSSRASRRACHLSVAKRTPPSRAITHSASAFLPAGTAAPKRNMGFWSLLSQVIKQDVVPLYTVPLSRDEFSVIHQVKAWQSRFSTSMEYTGVSMAQGWVGWQLRLGCQTRD